MVLCGNAIQNSAEDRSSVKKTPEHHIAFGPVPSRRLGQSLGINNVTTKACSYTCVYCQVGQTTEKIIEPQAFFSPTQIHEAVATRVRKLRARGLAIDYLTFVPDGEPTLDIALGESIEVLRDLDIPIAVITNGTLLWRRDVRARLARADLVSVKVDTVHEDGWRRVNLPHRDLSLDKILQGIREFAAGFGGTLITDTMLIAGINDDAASLTDTADFLAEIAPRIGDQGGRLCGQTRTQLEMTEDQRHGGSQDQQHKHPRLRLNLAGGVNRASRANS